MSSMNFGDFGDDDTINMGELARQREARKSSSAARRQPRKPVKPTRRQSPVRRQPSPPNRNVTKSSSVTRTPPQRPVSSSSSAVAPNNTTTTTNTTNTTNVTNTPNQTTGYQSSPASSLSESSLASYSASSARASSSAKRSNLRAYTRAKTQDTFDKEHAHHDTTLPANFDFNNLNRLLVHHEIKVKDVKGHRWLTRVVWGRRTHYRRSRPTIPVPLNDELKDQIIRDCHLTGPEAKHFTSKQAVIIACVEFLDSRQVRDAYIDGMPDNTRINHIIQNHYDNSGKEFDVKDALTSLHDNQKRIIARQGTIRSKSKWQFRILKHIVLGMLSIMSYWFKPGNRRQRFDYRDKNSVQGALSTDKISNQIADAAIGAGKTQSKRMYEKRYGHTAR